MLVNLKKSSILESVGAFIYCTSTGRYLFVLRNQGSYAGTWGVVGGKIETNESIIQSLQREIQEELGGIIQDSKITPIEKFTSTNGNFIYHTFIATVDDEFVPVLNNEHRGYCWVGLEDHPKPLHPGVLRTISFKAIFKKLKVFEECYKSASNTISL
jgi:8-oxo-dGTP pyrophosphatase MutT (NUDIX family)